MPGLDSIEGEGVDEDEMLVYVAGPYSKGKWGSNQRRAIRAAQNVLKMGHVPFLPHTMTGLWSVLYDNAWIKFDLKWLEQCDAILRLPGESEGADTEVEFAKARGIYVFGSIDELRTYSMKHDLGSYS